jgi:uncharacterized protein (TIGR03083 family)
MADDANTWRMIHAERAAMADRLEDLTPDQWAAQSLCAGWTVRLAAAHIVAGAEQTPASFVSGLLKAGLRFNTMIDRDAHRLGALQPAQIVERLRRRTATTNGPPAPAMAMLGEVVVHREDLLRPLGARGEPAEDAVNACLEMYTAANFPVGGKKRIHGLRLISTDSGWSHGDGPEVTGPALSLLLAMTGRPAGLDGLSGDGASQLGKRLPARIG